MTNAQVKRNDAPRWLRPRILRSFGRSASAWAALALVLSLTAHPAFAAGTPAGTVISTSGSVTFTVAGVPTTVQAPSVQFTVQEVVDVAATALAPVVAVHAGQTSLAVAYRITNLGNGTEATKLAVNAAVAGNQYNPVLHAPPLYLDTLGTGVYAVGDASYVPGTNDPVLAPGSSLIVFALVDIPAGLADQSRGRLAFTATSAIGTGAPGTTFLGKGNGGVDAVLGASGGQANTFSDLIVSSATVDVQKSVLIADLQGGARPEAGARLTYTLLISATGSTTVHAVVVKDAIPPATTYVPASMSLDGLALTDAADADAGEFLGGAAPAVQISIGDLPPGVTHTVRFVVTIN
jgi:uncharacterized repeat protein (TIGR01451 family)